MFEKQIKEIISGCGGYWHEVQGNINAFFMDPKDAQRCQDCIKKKKIKKALVKCFGTTLVIEKRFQSKYFGMEA